MGYLSSKDEGGRSNPIMPGYMPVFYFRTCDVTGKMASMKSSEGNDVQMAMPGDDVTIECELIAATPIEEGMRFALREGGKTIGQGLIVRRCELAARAAVHLNMFRLFTRRCV